MSGNYDTPRVASGHKATLARRAAAKHRPEMPDYNPATVIVAELIARLNEREFTPFDIVLSDGSRHAVPSPDHCTVTRLLRRVELESDDGSIVIINPLHITKLALKHKPAA